VEDEIETISVTLLPPRCGVISHMLQYIIKCNGNHSV